MCQQSEARSRFEGSRPKCQNKHTRHTRQTAAVADKCEANVNLPKVKLGKYEDIFIHYCGDLNVHIHW